jgi:hypothetical protein
MIKNVLQEIGGLGIYALTSLLLFFTVFTGALVWTFLQRKSVCEKMRALPLENDTEDL